MRRLADIMVASAILMVTFPLLMLVALAIKYESCGPAFKRTERIAADRRFTLLAFRTTGYDPEFVAPEWSRRTTRLGQFLRYTRIEILPQFINVFRGDQPLRAEWPPEFFRIEHLPQRIARPATTLVYPLVRLTDA